MKKVINNIIESINATSFDDGFLNFVQNFFCYKHNIDEVKYNSLIGYLSLDNGQKFIRDTLMDKSLKTLMLSDVVCNFDSYLDKEKREETGSYYTPPVLAKSMVKRAIADCIIKNEIINESKCEKLIFEQVNMLSELDIKKVENYINDMRIIDISCGTGIFLFKTLEVIVEIHQTLDLDIEFMKLSKQIYAVDLQSKPLEIFALIIYDYMLEIGGELGGLPNLNIACQDALSERIPFSGKFDIVIGNPPYVGEKGNKDLFDSYRSKDHLKDYYEGRMDLFYFFIYRGLEILKKDGLLSYITTNYFITADGASKLRRHLRNNTYFYRIINFDECKLFSDAKGMHNLIFTISNTSVEDVKIQYINKTNKSFKKEDIYYEKYNVSQKKLFSEDGNIIIYESESYFTIIDKILKRSDFRLKEIASVNQGIVSGADKVTALMIKNKFENTSVEKHNILLDEGIYVLENKKEFKSEFSRPFYKNSDINSYYVNENTNKSILYILDDANLSETCVEWRHLSRFYDVLSQRREVMRGTRKWFSLQWGRENSIFEGEKIVVPQRSSKNRFAFSEEAFYASADVYYITKSELPLKYLLALLNSKLMYFWLYNRGKRKGKSLELYAKPLSQIPVLKMEKKDEIFLIDCIEEILKNKGSDQNIANLIDEKLYAYYNITSDEKNIIEEMYQK